MLGIWFKTTWLQLHQINSLCVVCQQVAQESSQGFSNAKPICVCALDVLPYFGCNNAVIICPRSSGTSPWLLEL